MSYIYDLSDTWNASGTTFNAIKMNVTNTASASGSKLITLQVGGTAKFSVDKDGLGYFATALPVTSGGLGVATLSSGYLVKGNGTSAVSASVVYDNGTNVGIGTSSPPLKLSLLSGVTTNNVSTPVVMLGSDRTDYYASINSVRGSASTYIGLAFSTSNNAAPAEAMRIDHSGNVGIGTSSPSSRLHVAGSGDVTAYITTSSASGSNLALTAASSGAGELNMVNGFPLVFKTSNTERARIDSSGNLGLRVTPSAWSVNSAMQFASGGLWSLNSRDARLSQNIYYDGSNYRYITSNPGSMLLAYDNEFQFYRAATGTAGAVATLSESMRIDSSGNVGIGVTPSAKLDIAGTSRYTFNVANSYTLLTSLNAAGSAFVDAYTNGLSHIWQTSGSERARIDSSGNVGIGTSSPGSKLSVAGRIDATNTQSLLLNGATGTYGSFQYNGTVVGDIGTANQVVASGANTDFAITTRSTTALVFGTNTTERMRIDSSGNVGIGTTSPGSALVVGAGGAFRVNRSDNAAYNEIKYDTSDVFAFNQGNGGTYQFRISGTSYLGLATSYLAPGGNGSMNLGLSANRWATVYAATGTINTSDATEKQQIRELDEAEQAVAKRLKSLIRAYKFNDAVEAKGDGARVHVGVIAQDVAAAFEAEGLKASQYGVFCSDTWINDEGVEVTRLGVRYDELFAFIISAL